MLSNCSTPLLARDYVYSGLSSGELVCLSAASGEEVWRTDKVTDVKSGASLHLTPVGGRVLIYTEKGELILARVSVAGYDEVSRAKVLEPTYRFGDRNVAWAMPAYADRCVYARSDKELVCVSLAAD